MSDRKRRIKQSIIAGAAVGVLSCTSPSEPFDDIHESLIQTTDSSYVMTSDPPWGWVERIGFEFMNVTSDTVVVPGCRGAYHWHLEQRMGGDWVKVFTPAHLACHGPKRVPPATIWVDSMALFHFPDGEPRFTVWPADGEYRLVLLFALTSEGNLPPVARTTNSFTLTTEEAGE